MIYALSASALNKVDYVKSMVCHPTLKGKTVRVVGLGLPPFFMYDPFKHEMVGTDGIIMKIMAEKLGFNMTYRIGNGLYGQEVNDDGSITYTGTSGDVKNGDADIAIGGMTFVMTTAKIVDYLIAYDCAIYFKSKKPDTLLPYVNLTKSFSSYVWIAIGSTLLIVSLIYIAFMKFKIKQDWFDAFMLIYMVQFSQGNTTHCQCCKNTIIVSIGITRIEFEKYDSVKIFLFSWIIYVFFVHSAYDCNLRAYLMKQDLGPIVDSAQDIMNQNRLLLIPRGFQHSESQDYDIAATSADFQAVAKAMAKSMMSDGWYDINPNGNYALHSEMVKETL